MIKKIGICFGSNLVRTEDNEYENSNNADEKTVFRKVLKLELKTSHISTSIFACKILQYESLL